MQMWIIDNQTVYQIINKGPTVFKKDVANLAQSQPKLKLLITI